MALTVAGASIDAGTLSIPGSALSSAEAESYALSWALARSMYALQVLISYGVTVPWRVVSLGDNSATVDLAAADASVKAARHFMRRVAFNQDACDKETGMFASVKVPTEKNPVDYMGKMVVKAKTEASMKWVAGIHRAQI